MTRISTVLFDADGVIQQPSPGWFESWGLLIDDPDRTDEFLSDIFDAERPFALGKDGFEPAITAVLEKWQCSGTVQDALDVWTMITPCEEILRIVETVRDAGFTVGLASNQQKFRLRYMASSLGYSERFDHFFVSCELGIAKPSAGYFEQVVGILKSEAGEILFIDDSEANVGAAREVGMNAEVFHLSEGAEQMEKLLARHDVRI